MLAFHAQLVEDVDRLIDIGAFKFSLPSLPPQPGVQSIVGIFEICDVLEEAVFILLG